MSKRHSRLTGLFLEEVAAALRTMPGVNDHGGLLTVTGAELSGDDKVLTVFYSVMGTQGELENKGRLLAARSREIRTILYKRLRLRAVPEIVFKFDDTPAKAAHMESLLQKIRDEKKDEPQEEAQQEKKDK
jgi:ribosome-binding factor A